jgi:DNA-binding winged helix-turn-helix (wHTH) protein
MDNPDLSNLLPYVIVTSPQGQEQKIQLTEIVYKIGRLPGVNDIPLLDEDGVVSRIHHCILQREPEGWWLIDNSTNGTTVEREGHSVNVAAQPERKLLVTSEDKIRIHTWQLQFFDPARTKPIQSKPFKPAVVTPDASTQRWIFSLNEQILYRVDGEQRTRVDIRDKVRLCLDYMVRKNQTAGCESICKKQELIDAVWPPSENNGTYGDDSLHGLIREIRKILREKEDNRKWVDTVKNQGYVLRIDYEGNGPHSS